MYGWPDFQLADNVGQKMHYAHLSLYSKTVIFAKEKLILARNILCKGYVGGNGTRFFDPLDEEGGMWKSIIVIS